MDKELKKRLRRFRRNKMKYMLVCFLGGRHIHYLKKHDIFGMLGENCLFQPFKLMNNPKLIKIHNNVKIASGVTFYEHDVINSVFSYMDNVKYRSHNTVIEIFDNCFIGGGSIIVGDVSIGPNAIVAAGSVVTKDVPEGTVVGGNPARVIGSFDELHKKRKACDAGKTTLSNDEIWSEYYKRRNTK